MDNFDHAAVLVNDRVIVATGWKGSHVLKRGTVSSVVGNTAWIALDTKKGNGTGRTVTRGPDEVFVIYHPIPEA